MASEKTAVIEYLFDKFWDERTASLGKSTMSLVDVSEAIRACNVVDGLGRSDKNPANFLKDIVRSKNASKHWPEKIAALGYTGEQRTGQGDSFAFVKYKEGQTEAFPDLFRPTELTIRNPIQSLSLPRAAKELGRSDEAWLIQTVVNLRVVEQHLATQSKLDVVDISHLQMNVKLRATEIDAVYLASIQGPKGVLNALITCEAKKDSERILLGQITSQVSSAFGATSVDLVVPIAVRSVRGVGVHLIEFESVHRADVDTLEQVSFAHEAIYAFVPPVKGI